MKNALLIFIKNPVKGRVKTRLARTVGDEKALEIYLELSKITRMYAEMLRDVQCYVFYSDHIDFTDDWREPHFIKRVQTGRDLGERIFHAFESVLKLHEKVCIIGSDCPTLNNEILQQAFDALGTHDFVIGPSTDGGYYLLGMSNTATASSENDSVGYLFEEMPWSTARVFAETRERILQHEKTPAVLPELTDIDEEADWLLFQKNAPYRLKPKTEP